MKKYEVLRASKNSSFFLFCEAKFIEQSLTNPKPTKYEYGVSQPNIHKTIDGSFSRVVRSVGEGTEYK